MSRQKTVKSATKVLVYTVFSGALNSEHVQIFTF